MAALAQQLEQLKLQQEELEKRIQEEEERKKKLNNEASIERLEALVQPFTDTLNHTNTRHGNTQRIQYIMRYEQELQNYNQQIIQRPNIQHFKPRKNLELEKEEIFVTLIGILKKQDEKITKLAESIDNLQFYKNKVLDEITDLRSNKMTFNTKCEISVELANFLGKTNRQVSRTEVTREITTYIRNNNLQDPQNKRIILADLKLKELLKLKPNDELTYFNLQRYIGPHFVKN